MAFFIRRRRRPKVSDTARWALSRRELLRLSALGAGALALGPLARVAHAGVSDQKLVVIFANGGVRSTDFCDAYLVSADLEASYTNPQRQLVTGDWYLPPAAAPLLLSPAGNDWSGQMAVVREVQMETASHDTGVRIALAGTSRSSAAAGPVIVSNESGLVGSYDIKSVSFDTALAAGSLVGPVTGEPSDLVDLFAPVDFTGDASLDTALRDAIADHDDRVVNSVRSGSPLHGWRDLNALSRAIEGAGFDSLIDPGSTSTPGDPVYDFANPSTGTPLSTTFAQRFAGAWLALSNEISPVATVMMSGFDTHTGSQDALCGQLATGIAVLMDKLQSDGILGQTTIVVVSDFDRTPTFNGSNGTDHWLHGSVPFFGAGFAPGPIGALSAAPGKNPSPYSRADIWATVMDIFGVDAGDWLTDGTAIGGLV
jgi:hypothetical protein